MKGQIPNTLYERGTLIDSSALYALLDQNDQHHKSALDLMSHARQDRYPVFITNTVIIESYRLILHKLGRVMAHKFLEGTLSDIKNGLLILERMSEADETEAQNMVYRFKSHDLTLTDTINFCVMNRMGIYKMFGFDSDCLIVGLEMFEIENI